MSSLIRFFLALIALLATSISVAAAEGDAGNVEAAIRSVLSAQGEAWNRGDLVDYMASIARGEHTRHIFNNEITVGYTAIEARLQARYPDPSDMGAISYSDLDVSVLAPDAASAFAHWTFQHGDNTFAGVFTLIFREINGSWVIVHDHSTAFPNE
ncbi:MAG: nuclear transport factor 2 family protein [Myxococcales bacterium]|nr:nuclear transport factor 2 family protein [Myxococcales bacterium]